MTSNETQRQSLAKASSYPVRQNRLRELIGAAGIKTVCINPGPSLLYLTGLNFHLMERPVLALFSIDETITIICPELEAAKTASLDFPNKVFYYGEDPATWPAAFQQAFESAGMDGQTGVEPTRLRFLEYDILRKTAPAAEIVSAENILADLRMRKDPQEIGHMQKAVMIAEKGLLKTLPLIKAGRTERQVAADLTIALLRAGSDPELPFSPIVSGGPNSANPHASPSDRPLKQGDLLVIDWGAFYHGYCSDLTRTFAIGAVEQEFSLIAEVVLKANAAGRTAGKPGIPASAVDAAAREIIEKAGYGKYFTHRTGHGVGMEGHEPPYMRAGNPMLLLPGMTYTVEPGIYLPGRGGVRIEDNVVVTETGAESLSHLTRELITI